MMNTSKDLTFRVNRSRLLRLIGISILFIVVGLYLAILHHDNIGYISLLFGGLALLVSGIKLVTTRGGIHFTEDGFRDYVSGLRMGLIRWRDVTGTQDVDFRGRQVLLVKLRDPNVYITRGGPIRRYLNQKNFDTYGSPVWVAISLLDVDSDIFIEEFNSFRSRHGQDA